MKGQDQLRVGHRQGDNELFIYHPYQFGQLPKVEETDFLVILGGPMSPNDQFRMD
jgi:GMP synthase-like glutamine amidotransferase